MNLFSEHKKLDLISVNKEILAYWKKSDIFQKTLDEEQYKKEYVFYEGPPSANGLPGIHHVLARAVKDIFCRYNTLKGKRVERKAGWDTHGLPVELGVEKELGIKKEDIGKKISVEEYNDSCRKAVMRYKKEWETLTEKIGFWLDMEEPYVTFENKYIETVWWLLKQLFEKNLLYQDYKIQPYSPAAGSALSSHELNQPGCYKTVKDTSATVLFEIKQDDCSKFLFSALEKEGFSQNISFLAWTTTPWTLAGNSALAVGKDILYSLVQTFNPYTQKKINVILASSLLSKYFKENTKCSSPPKEMPKGNTYSVILEFKGEEIKGIQYHQLLPYVNVTGKAFEVLIGSFVTTEDGTGIVHLAANFGADDYQLIKENGITPAMVLDKERNKIPIVDKKGRYTEHLGEFSGRGVKPAFENTKQENTLDVDICVKLKKEGKAFQILKYEHSYPHCWRTDKPVLYYPMESWFVKTTAIKDKLISLNSQINWKPESTGTGRFGNWLENLQDWNLSRSRHWGIGLPLWATEDRTEIYCIGSFSELKTKCEEAVQAGIMEENPLAIFQLDDFSGKNYASFDCHKPFIDNIVLVSKKGEPMRRESDLIDVWFDSGAMPYAQYHYPFENKKDFESRFPADFIAEGVDQTRGWFFTLHVIAAACFDSIAYKNVVSNGLVLDKKGQKMSKRLGNSISPEEVLQKHGADSLRWYMITNSQPWDNLKFNAEGISETERKFFGTLFNTYSFFALYANIDNFTPSKERAPVTYQTDLDKWILSKLQTLILDVENAYSSYEPTRAGRLIETFVIDNLSNWHVRLSRRRFWKSSDVHDKNAAYQTLFECLLTVSKLISPIAPFYSEKLYSDLTKATNYEEKESVHLTLFPVADTTIQDKTLEETIDFAKNVTSIALSIRKKSNIKVRQPLQALAIPKENAQAKKYLKNVTSIIQTEVNVRDIILLDSEELVLKEIKPNFKVLGPKHGKYLKKIQAFLSGLEQKEIVAFEKKNELPLECYGETIKLSPEDVEIVSKDIIGWVVDTNKGLTVALDITLNDELISVGIAREFVNRIQNKRKSENFSVTDRIFIEYFTEDALVKRALEENKEYICAETLCTSIKNSAYQSDKEDFTFIEIPERGGVNCQIGKI